MEHSVTLTLSELGGEEENSSRLFEAIEAVAPRHDPVIAQNLVERWLSVTIVLDADDAVGALESARTIIVTALERAGLPTTRLIQLGVLNEEVALPAA
jgi:hypothetical protein